MPVAIAVIGAVAAIGGTVLTYTQQRKAARARRKQEKLAADRSRRNLLRQSQIERAKALASAQGLGAQFSSATPGGIESIANRTGAELGFQSQFSALSGIVSSATQKASLGQGISNLGQLGMSFGTFPSLAGAQASTPGAKPTQTSNPNIGFITPTGGT